MQPLKGHLPPWIYFYLRTAIARDEGALQATLAMKSFSNHDTLPRLISSSLGRFSADGQRITACRRKGLMNITGLCSIGFAVLLVCLIQIRLAMPSFEKISPACQCKAGPSSRIADSNSKNALSFLSAGAMKRFRSSRCESTIQIYSLAHGHTVSVLSDSNRRPEHPPLAS